MNTITADFSPKYVSSTSSHYSICSYCNEYQKISSKCSRFHLICVDCTKMFSFSYCLLCHENLEELASCSDTDIVTLEDLLNPPVVQTSYPQYPQYSPVCDPTPKHASGIKKCCRKEDESSLYETCSRNFFLCIWDYLSSIPFKFGKKIIPQKKNTSTAMIIAGLLAKIGKNMGKPLYKSLKRKCGLSGTLKLGLLLAILVIGIHEFSNKSEE